METSYHKNHYNREIMASSNTVECEIRQVSCALRKLLAPHETSGIVLKIDVEGAEYEIMKDIATNYPELFARTRIIMGETLPISPQTSGDGSLEKLMEILSSLGYSVAWKEPNGIGNRLHNFELLKPAA